MNRSGDLLHDGEVSDIALIVDSRLSFSAVPIAMDALGIDVLLTPEARKHSLSRRAFPCSAFPRKDSHAPARTRTAATTFDFLEFKKNQEGDMTPTTPSVAHIHVCNPSWTKYLPKVWRHASHGTLARMN